MSIIQVNDEYLKTLEILSKKLKFIEADPMAKTSKALKDVQPELEKLRQKAVSKVIKISLISGLLNFLPAHLLGDRKVLVYPCNCIFKKNIF